MSAAAAANTYMFDLKTSSRGMLPAYHHNYDEYLRDIIRNDEDIIRDRERNDSKESRLILKQTTEDRIKVLVRNTNAIDIINQFFPTREDGYSLYNDINKIIVGYISEEETVERPYFTINELKHGITKVIYYADNSDKYGASTEVVTAPSMGLPLYNSAYQEQYYYDGVLLKKVIYYDNEFIHKMVEATYDEEYNFHGHMLFYDESGNVILTFSFRNGYVTGECDYWIYGEEGIITHKKKSIANLYYDKYAGSRFPMHVFQNVLTQTALLRSSLEVFNNTMYADTMMRNTISYLKRPRNMEKPNVFIGMHDPDNTLTLPYNYTDNTISGTRYVNHPLVDISRFGVNNPYISAGVEVGAAAGVGASVGTRATRANGQEEKSEYDPPRDIFAGMTVREMDEIRRKRNEDNYATASENKSNNADDYASAV